MSDGTTAIDNTATSAEATAGTVGNTATAAATGATTSDKMFTQADVDRIMGETRRTGRQAGINEFLKELGVDNPDTLKATLAEARKAREASMTEAERANARIAELERQAQEAAALREQATSYETALTAHADSLLRQAKLPKHVKALVEKLNPIDRVQWFTDNAEELSKPQPVPNLNGDASGRARSGGLSEADRLLLASELGVDPRFLPKELRS